MLSFPIIQFCSVSQLYPTVCNPMDCSLPGSFVHGIFQARVLERGTIAFSVRIETVPFFLFPWFASLSTYCQIFHLFLPLLLLLLIFPLCICYITFAELRHSFFQPLFSFFLVFEDSVDILSSSKILSLAMSHLLISPSKALYIFVSVLFCFVF